MSSPATTNAQEALQAVQRWQAEQGEDLPAAVRQALEQHAAIVQALEGSERSLRRALSLLRRAMGIEPKSERRPSRDPMGPRSGDDRKRPRTKREKLEVDLARLERLSTWHGDVRERQKGQMARIQKKLETLPIDEIELTPKQQADNATRVQQFMQDCAAGDGADPALQPVKETLMTGSEITTSDKVVELKAPSPSKEEEVVKTLYDERVRYDFTMTVTRVEVDVEKHVVVGPDGTRRVVTASTASLGPARYAVTWGFLSNLVVLVAQYGIPIHRMGRLLSTAEKKFTTTSLSRMLRYVAERFVPIYLYLFDQLADADVLSGDDTTPRVLEVRRHFAQKEPEASPPWQDYRCVEVAQQQLTKDSSDHTLEARLAAEMGFESRQRTGKGPKKSLNTTVLSGRADPQDPRSLIVLYRTHLGAMGNLLEVLLSKRSPSKKELTVQADLATVNPVVDELLNKMFKIVYAGCASHARRPFAQHQDDDPELATYMLNFFKGLFIHEHGLDLHGRNEENVTKVRGTHSRQTWEDIRQLAEIMSTKWSKETKLGQAARYIVRHYDKVGS